MNASFRECLAPITFPIGRINPQDDTFLNKKVWDFEHIPAEQYPLLLHLHPLVIYRQQKRRNFNYYDPLTTGDSSLSVCIQSIMAHEVGHYQRALEYARYAVLMDLGNVEGKVKDGCHIASLGGSWMLCVNGFAGMREYGGRLSFAPRLPHGIRRLSFSLLFRGRHLRVTIDDTDTSYLLREGKPLARSVLHPLFGITVGGISAGYLVNTDAKEGYDQAVENRYFFASLSAGIEINPARHLRLALRSGYRFAANEPTLGLARNALSGPEAAMALRFVWNTVVD